MFELFGLILRLPFFCIGLVAVSFLWVPFALSLTILITALGILWLPFIFISAAFCNDRKRLESYLKKLEGSPGETMGSIPDAYRGLYNWLVKH